MPVRILRQILRVIVGAETYSDTNIEQLHDRGHGIGRLSVNVDVDPPVDRTSFQSGQ